MFGKTPDIWTFFLDSHFCWLSWESTGSGLGKHVEVRDTSEAVGEGTWKRSLGSGPISAIYKFCDLGQVI